MPDRTDTLRVIDQVLTNIANSYENTQFVGTKIMPEVYVEKMAGKVPSFGKSMFVSRTLQRALRGDSNRIPPTDLEMIEYDLTEKDVEIALDYLEISESHLALKYEARTVKELVDIISLGKEKDISVMLQDPAIMTGNQDVEQGWATPATGTPIADIKVGKEAMRNAIVKEPNVAIFSKDAFEVAILCDEVTGLITYSGKKIVTADLLAEAIGIPNIYIGMSKHSADAEGTLTDLWANTCILAYVDQADKVSRSEYNPSFGYLFQKKGKPEIDTYYEAGGKRKIIRNTDNYIPKIIGISGGYLLYDCKDA